MPNLTPKQKVKLKQLENLAQKAKESGLNVSVESPTDIRINLPKSEEKEEPVKK